MTDSLEYINALLLEFKQNSNPDIAKGQKAYMKNHFAFYGIKSPERREIQKPFLIQKYLPPKKDLSKIIKTLWAKPERECHYFAQEMARKYANQFEKKDLLLFEFMIKNKSWWDTVDFIAPNLIGIYFKQFPEQRDKYIDKWLVSNHLWLQRTALLFQLKYKKETDTKVLAYCIKSLLGSSEFFINKAIGWVLREYSKTNPDWVIGFVDSVVLDKLSQREALRLLK